MSTPPPTHTHKLPASPAPPSLLLPRCIESMEAAGTLPRPERELWGPPQPLLLARLLPWRVACCLLHRPPFPPLSLLAAAGPMPRTRAGPSPPVPGAAATSYVADNIQWVGPNHPTCACRSSLSRLNTRATPAAFLIVQLGGRCPMLGTEHHNTRGPPLQLRNILAYLAPVVGSLYLISPIDLIPDLIPIIG